jgi:hypothetical protein
MIRGKKTHYLHTEKTQGESLLSFIKKQIIGFFCLILAIILSIPGVPGPGFLFFALALLLLDYPSKRRLFVYLKGKRFFRVVRLLLWKKLNVFLILPKE